MTLSGQAYRCSAGETFDSVALVVYGNEKYASELLCANPLLCTVPVFAGGEVLDLPVVEIPDSEDEEADDYMPPVAPWKE